MEKNISQIKTTTVKCKMGTFDLDGLREGVPGKLIEKDGATLVRLGTISDNDADAIPIPPFKPSVKNSDKYLFWAEDAIDDYILSECKTMITFVDQYDEVYPCVIEISD